MPFQVVPSRDRNLNRLIRKGREASYARDEMIYRAGDEARHLFLVTGGHVGLLLPPRRGGSGRVAQIAGPGELFGDEALEPDRHRLYGARASEATTVVVLSGSSTLRALRTTTHTLPLLLGVRYRELARALWAGPGAGGPTTGPRLADVLLELTRRLGEPAERGGGAVRIPHWLTHQELADLAGAHRSTVTTQLNEWIYEGLLETEERALVVLRPDELQRRGSGRVSWISGR